jgi:hypothetical protein
VPSEIPLHKLDSVFARIALWLTAATFFLPKINLLEIEGSRAGVRIDDFLLLGSAICLGMAAMAGGAQLWRTKIVRWFFIFVGLTLPGWLFGQLNPLFSLRLVEYSVFLFVAYWVATRREVVTILLSYSGVNLVMALLQYAGVVGGYTVLGYAEEFEGRVVGLTNGPWELALVSVLLMSFFLHQRAVAVTVGRGAAIVGGFGLLIFLGGSRTPLAIWLLVSAIYVADLLSRGMGLSKKIFWPCALCFMALAMWGIVESDTYLGARTREFLNRDNLAYLWNALSRIHTGPVSYSISQDDALLSAYGMDASMSQRLHILKILVSSYVNGGPIVWIGGVGFGAFGPSTDLGWVRLLVETGALGAACYVVWLVRCTRVAKTVGVMVLCLALNMSTLDAFLSYKAMSVFLFVLGLFAAERDAMDQKAVIANARH